jgi:UrcA family protein
MIKLVQIVLGGAVLAAAAVSPAAAATPVAAGQEQASVAVSYAGLDLAKPADAARLDRRIRMAAQAVCGDNPLRDVTVSPAVQECEKEAVARARGQVGLAMRSGGGSQVVALRSE